MARGKKHTLADRNVVDYASLWNMLQVVIAQKEQWTKNDVIDSMYFLEVMYATSSLGKMYPDLPVRDQVLLDYDLDEDEEPNWGKFLLTLLRRLFHVEDS